MGVGPIWAIHWLSFILSWCRLLASWCMRPRSIKKFTHKTEKPNEANFPIILTKPKLGFTLWPKKCSLEEFVGCAGAIL